MSSPPTPKISALASAVADVTGRVSQLAHELDRSETEGVAADLFEAERLLRNASRRLERARRRAGG